MGAGKTSVGRALAERLGWYFEDLDDRIERRERRKIHEIFRESGEPAFRLAERRALRQLLNEVEGGTGKVLALGGGAFVQKQNAKLIEAAGVPTVFLDADVEELWQRCQTQAAQESAERPLLSSFTKFCALHEARQPYYAKALFSEKTSGKTVEKITAELIEKLGLASRKRSNRRHGEKS